MRSLATISSRSAPPSSAGEAPREYISRTFTLARRGRSASVVTWRDATSAGGRRSGDLRQPREDLASVAKVVGVVEDLLEVQLPAALVRSEKIAQRDALIPAALAELLDNRIGPTARHARLDERQQNPLGEQRAVRQLEVGAHPLRIDDHPRSEETTSELQQRQYLV